MFKNIATNDDALPAAVAEVLGISVKEATEKLRTKMKKDPKDAINPKAAKMLGVTPEEGIEIIRSTYGTDDPKVIRKKVFISFAKIGGTLGLIIGYFFGGLKGSLIGFLIGVSLFFIPILVGLFIRILAFFK